MLGKALRTTTPTPTPTGCGSGSSYGLLDVSSLRELSGGGSNSRPAFWRELIPFRSLPRLNVTRTKELLSVPVEGTVGQIGGRPPFAPGSALLPQAVQGAQAL